VVTVRKLLTQAAYAGDFVYNRMKSGQFSIVNEAGEVVEADSGESTRSWKPTNAGLITRLGTYKPLIDPAIFAQAQARLSSFGGGKRRPHTHGYPLSRILICDNCGRAMYGFHPTGRERAYRCRTNGVYGMGTCGNFQINEAVILPFVLRLLGEEISDLTEFLSRPPDSLVYPRREQAERRRTLERERTTLDTKIKKATERLLEIADRRTRQALDARVTAMRDELEQIDAELANKPAPERGYTRAEVRELAAWWEKFNDTAVSMPLYQMKPSTRQSYDRVGFWQQDPFDDSAAILVDRRRINEALYRLGAEVRLRWRRETVTTAGGATRNRNVFAGGRLRLGQKTRAIDSNYIQAAVRGR
jgi:hypothetical protein